MMETTFSVSSPPSISASRRSISSPPMKFTALTVPAARNLPRRCGVGLPGTFGLREILGELGEFAAGLGGEHLARANHELIQRQAADGGVIAEFLQHFVALGV